MQEYKLEDKNIKNALNFSGMKFFSVKLDLNPKKILKF